MSTIARTTTDSPGQVRPVEASWVSSKWSKLIIAVIGVVLLYAVYSLVGPGGTSIESIAGSDGPMAFADVEQGPLTIAVTSSGNIQSSDRVVMRCEVEGSTTIIWIIEEGKKVKAGDKLVELDANEFKEELLEQQIRVQNAEAAFIRSRENLAVVKNQAESDVDKAKLELQLAKLDFKKYNDGDYPQAIRTAEATITIAEEELQRAKDKVDWSQKLAKEGLVTRTELQADELARKKADLDLSLARTDFQLLKQYTHQRNITELESNVNQAERALERVVRKAAADVVQAEAELVAKQSEFDRQTTKLEKRKEQIAKCIIRAPVDGQVVYATTGYSRYSREPIEEGQTVRERQELVYLPKDDAIKAEIKVHESHLKSVKKGMPVRLAIDAYPDRIFHGKIDRISPMPDSQIVWLNPDLKVYSTDVSLDEDQDLSGLRPGLGCRAEVILADYDDITYVPLQSVLRIDNKPTVYVANGRSAEPRNVEIGLDNNRMIHIKKGLESGERVLLTPPLGPSMVKDKAYAIRGEVATKSKKAGKAAGHGRGHGSNGHGSNKSSQRAH